MPLWLGIAFADLNFASLQQQLIARFGPARINLLQDWQAQLEAVKKQPESEKLKRFNDFFNRNIVFDEDLTIWNQTDYWATPLETIGRGRADCEDFSIIKYYSLLQAGVPTELHVYPGAYHASEVFAPNAELSQRIWQARIAAFRRALHG